jgi:hypothetical protein
MSKIGVSTATRVVEMTQYASWSEHTLVGQGQHGLGYLVWPRCYTDAGREWCPYTFIASDGMILSNVCSPHAKWPT